MAVWLARGEIELRGVDFFIQADTIEEAREKAKAGEYDFYEVNGAETVDWDIRPDTVEPND